MRKIINHNAGFSLVELLVGLSILVVAILISAEVIKFSTQIQSSNKGQAAEYDFYQTIGQYVGDAGLCDKALDHDQVLSESGGTLGAAEVKLKDINIEFQYDINTPIVTTDKPIQIDETYHQKFGISAMAIENGTILLDRSADIPPTSTDIYSFLLRVDISRRGLYLGSKKVSRSFPFFAEVDRTSKKIVKCGINVLGPTYCASLRGKWNDNAGKCEYDAEGACNVSGSYWDPIYKKCTQCLGVGAVWDGAAGKCKYPNATTSPNVDPSVPAKFPSTHWVKYVDPASPVTNWNCVHMRLIEGAYYGGQWRACANAEGRICNQNQMQCVEQVLVNGGPLATDIPRCTTSILKCE